MSEGQKSGPNVAGILGGIAALITAVGGIYIALQGDDTTSSSEQPEGETSTPYIETRERFDPSPFDGNLTGKTGVNFDQCKQRCLDDGRCKSLYWVPANSGSCWTKSLVSNGEYKNYERGIGGIKREE